MDEDKPSRGRRARIVVIAACLLILGACGFSRDGLTTAKGTDTGFTDDAKADTDLTDSGFTVDTGDSYSDDYSDYTDDYSDYTDEYTDEYTDDYTDSSDETPVDPTPLIPLLIDPPALPATPPAPGPPARGEPAPDGTQTLVYGTYTYDNLDDFLYGDWNCLGCDTDRPTFAGAVDKLSREANGKFFSNSVARFTDPTEAEGALKDLIADREADEGDIWEKQFNSIPGIPGAAGSLSAANPAGQDYEIHFVVKGDLYILDFGSAPNTPVDISAADATAQMQYQKALAGG